MIEFRIVDPNEVCTALGVLVNTAGECQDYSFEVGPFDDKKLLADQTIWVDGDDEVEAAEVLGQRLVDAGIVFEAL